MTLSEQAATGSADREAVAIALGWVKKSEMLPMRVMAGSYEHSTWWRDDSHFGLPYAPDYQRDLAATLAEIERRGWGYDVCNYPSTWAVVWEPERASYRPRCATAEGTTIANAACAALLKALENSDANE